MELPKETSRKGFRSSAEFVGEYNSDSLVLTVTFGNPPTLLKSVDIHNGHAYYCIYCSTVLHDQCIMLLTPALEFILQLLSQCKSFRIKASTRSLKMPDEGLRVLNHLLCSQKSVGARGSITAACCICGCVCVHVCAQ